MVIGMRHIGLRARPALQSGNRAAAGRHDGPARGSPGSEPAAASGLADREALPSFRRWFDTTLHFMSEIEHSLIERWRSRWARSAEEYLQRELAERSRRRRISAGCRWRRHEPRRQFRARLIRPLQRLADFAGGRIWVPTCGSSIGAGWLMWDPFVELLSAKHDHGADQPINLAASCRIRRVIVFAAGRLRLSAAADCDFLGALRCF